MVGLLYMYMYIDRFQKVQNSQACVVDPSVRRHAHITVTPLENFIGLNSPTYSFQHCLRNIHNTPIS